MSEEKVYPIISAAEERGYINTTQYQEMYDASINHPETFWPEQANAFLDWSRTWDTLTESDFRKGEAA